MSIADRSAGSTHQGSVSRRAAVGRLLRLGAGVAVAVAVPTPAIAQPAAPAAPDWLPTDPALLTALERIAQAFAMCPEGTRTELASQTADLVTILTEIRTSPSRRSEPALPQAPTVPPLSVAAELRVVTVRFAKLTPNERRRVRRWIARQPTDGVRLPTLQLEAGRGKPERDYDFLRVVAPGRLRADASPYTYAAEAAEQVNQIIAGRGNAVRSYSLFCGHHWPAETGSYGLVAMDGRAGPGSVRS